MSYSLPLTIDMSERSRMQESARRRRLLDGVWEVDLVEAMAQYVAPEQMAAWGRPDLTKNVFRSVVSQLSILYDREPIIDHPDPTAAERMRDLPVPEGEPEPVDPVVFLPPTEDPAPVLARHRFVVVGTREHPKWLLFVCPCGCGQEVKLNLMARFHPRWSIDVAPDGLTVHPSVDMTTCGAHFWVRKGGIAWAGQAPG